MLIIVAVHLLNYIGNFVEWRIHKHLNHFEQLENSENAEEPTDEESSFLSRLFFCWVNPLIRKGYEGKLKDMSNLFKLPPSLRVEVVEKKFVESAPSYYTDGLDFSLPRALFNAYGIKYLSLGILRLLGDCFSFAGPILLHYLVTELEDGDERVSLYFIAVPYKYLFQSYGYYFASLMLITSFLSALCDFNFNFYVNKISLKIRCATVTALYDKLLQVPTCRLSKSFSAGQLINFMSTDIDRIVNFFNSFHALWSLIFKLGIALYLLYREVGLAFLSGFGAALLMVPLNLLITFKIGSMSAKIMNYKDQRMRVSFPILNSSPLLFLVDNGDNESD